jgi:hypothetical protein
MVKAIKIKAALEISKRLQNQAYPKKTIYFQCIGI